jgi:hypothetical protein
MPKFMLLLHDDPAALGDASPEDIQGIIGEYVAWRRRLEADGRLVAAHKLTDEGGREMSLADGRLRVVDGPYSEAKEVLGGYFLVTADDYDAAVELARDCPHLRYGRRIELRRVDEIDG